MSFLSWVGKGDGTRLGWDAHYAWKVCCDLLMGKAARDVQRQGQGRHTLGGNEAVEGYAAMHHEDE